MTDIVERLRDVTSQTLTSECHQAADEIERLREAKKDALWVINQGQIEINRLHEELLSRHNELRAKADEIELLGAWVRELRSALGELRTHLHAAGRRPEECYEMSVIDNALGWRAGDE
jgi:chromosome segregation ATPase